MTRRTLLAVDAGVKLDLSLRGAIVLWSIDALLLAISGAELATYRRSGGS